MSKQDRQKLGVLIVLLVVLGLTLVLGYRMTRPPTALTVQSGEEKPADKGPVAVQTDAKLRMEVVETPQSAQNVGQNNIFAYRQPKPAPGVLLPGSSQQRGALPPPPVVTPPANRGPTPPPPPPIPFRYQGFAVVNSDSGMLTAFLSDDQRHYNVTVGEVLMGRYRIVRISDSAIEMEDMEYNRRQALPLIKQ